MGLPGLVGAASVAAARSGRYIVGRNEAAKHALRGMDRRLAGLGEVESLSILPGGTGAGLLGRPGHRLPGQINTHDGGRGVYFEDPSGHNLEIITRPYGDAR